MPGEPAGGPPAGAVPGSSAGEMPGSSAAGAVPGAPTAGAVPGAPTAGAVPGSPASDAPDRLRLRPPRNPVDRRAIGWWRVHLALWSLVPLAGLLVLAFTVDGARTLLLIVAAATALLGVAAVVGLPRWWYELFRWEVTETAVYTRSAVLWEELRIAPISRIQTVDTSRGPLEQAFGLATVTVTTASAKGALKIEGLDHEVAADLVEQLTVVTQATPDDAT